MSARLFLLRGCEAGWGDAKAPSPSADTSTTTCRLRDSRSGNSRRSSAQTAWTGAFPPFFFLSSLPSTSRKMHFHEETLPARTADHPETLRGAIAQPRSDQRGPVRAREVGFEQPAEASRGSERQGIDRRARGVFGPVQERCVARPVLRVSSAILPLSSCAYARTR